MANATPTDPHLGSPLHLLHRAGQCADELFAMKVGRADITPRQFEVLRAISQSSEPSQTQLVTRTGVDRSTLADIVRRLAERGLVDRQRTRHDARTYALSLSPAGEAALQATEPGVAQANARILDLLPAPQRAAFLEALAKIVAEFGAAADARSGTATAANDTRKTASAA